jgi:aquaporin Z
MPHCRSKVHDNWAEAVELRITERIEDLQDPKQEWRRLFSEALGTFFLVLVAVSLAFALRGDFPWRRVPGYIVVQLAGAALAALFLQAVVNVSATFGSNYPASGYSDGAAFLMEAVLTLGPVSVILGTASGAQNIGIIGAFGAAPEPGPSTS